MIMAICVFKITLFAVLCFQLFYISHSQCTSGPLVLPFKRGVIDSPSFPKKYPDNSRCKWIIRLSEKSTLTLNFTTFDVEIGDSTGHPCRYDHVNVYSYYIEDANQDVSAEYKYGPFCGTQRPFVTAEGMKFVIEFFSDSGTNGLGFHAVYAIEKDHCLGDNGGCQQICQNTPATYKCLCRKGYTLHSDRHNCINTGAHEDSEDSQMSEHVSKKDGSDHRSGGNIFGVRRNFPSNSPKAKEYDNKEINHESYSIQEKAINWIQKLRQKGAGNDRWGNKAPRIAIALHLTNPSYFDGSNTVGNELAYEIDNLVLSNLFRDQIIPILETDLALYIHALLATCQNPENFHGINLVSKLRHLVNDQANHTNPIVILALCNAKGNITEEDVDKVTNAFNYNKRPVWTSSQALALIALSCISDRSDAPTIAPSMIEDMSSQLKRKQHDNGGFENVYTTALVVQAIFASKSEKGLWRMRDVENFIVNSQMDDGSFGSFLNTYYILPVLNHRSLLNIDSSHCKYKLTDKVPKPLENMIQKQGKKIWVKYSLWFGKDLNTVRSLDIHVFENSTLLDVMQVAETWNDKYKFEYFLSDSKPYIYALSGYQDDPESENFWFLYRINSTGFTHEIINLSPVDVIPEDSEEYVMWYRREHWNNEVQNLLEIEASSLNN